MNARPPITLFAKPDPNCPLCLVWGIHAQERPADMVKNGAPLFDASEAHSFLVSGYWVALARKGSICTAHQHQLEALDRAMLAGRESLIRPPGGDT